MIEMGKTYRTRDGREVRIYATDGAELEQVHGAINNGGVWHAAKWTADGLYNFHRGPHSDLVESDPHGILPRHRELLAGVYQELNYREVTAVLRSDKPALALPYDVQAALIALARLEKEKGE